MVIDVSRLRQQHKMCKVHLLYPESEVQLIAAGATSCKVISYWKGPEYLAAEVNDCWWPSSARSNMSISTGQYQHHCRRQWLSNTPDSHLHHSLFLHRQPQWPLGIITDTSISQLNDSERATVLSSSGDYGRNPLHSGSFLLPLLNINFCCNPEYRKEQ